MGSFASGQKLKLSQILKGQITITHLLILDLSFQDTEGFICKTIAFLSSTFYFQPSEITQWNVGATKDSVNFTSI